MEYLVVPNLWSFAEPEVEWTLAVDWDDAVPSRPGPRQHVLAYRIGLLRAEHRNSVADLAVVLREGRGTLTSKLNGHLPATEDDLIRWSWLTGDKRRSYSPEALWDQPFRVPTFPFSRVPGSFLPDPGHPPGEESLCLKPARTSWRCSRPRFVPTRFPQWETRAASWQRWAPTPFSVGGSTGAHRQVEARVPGTSTKSSELLCSQEASDHATELSEIKAEIVAGADLTARLNNRARNRLHPDRRAGSASAPSRS